MANGFIVDDTGDYQIKWLGYMEWEEKSGKGKEPKDQAKTSGEKYSRSIYQAIFHWMRHARICTTLRSLCLCACVCVY